MATFNLKMFLLLAPAVVFASESFADFKLLRDLTVNFTSYYSANCIELLHPYTNWGSGFQIYFKLFKKLVEHPRWAIGLHSYEKYLKIREISGYRGHCSKPLKVTVANEASKDGFAKMTYDYPMSNSLWLIIIKNVTVEEYFEHSKLPFNTQAITATGKNPDLVHFHEFYRVGTGYPLRIKYFGNWTRSHGMNVSTGHIYSRRSDLEGKVFQTGYGKNWPLVYINESKQLDGYFPKLWYELEGLMNISSQHKFSNDETIGRQRSDGNWTGLIGMLLDNQIDIIISDLTISQDRWDAIDFARPLLSSNYQIYFRYLGNNLEWTAVFRPFAASVWLSIVGYMLVASVSLAICNYICMLYGLENHTFNHFGPIESFFFILQSLCQQGYGKVPKSSSSRIIFLMSYLVSAILIPSYSASLISSLANQTPIKPFDSLKEMLRDGTYRLIVGRNTAEWTYFSKAKDGLWTEVYEKLIKDVPREYGKSLNSSSGQEYKVLCVWHKYALFGVETLIRMKMENSNQTFCRVTTFSRALGPVHQSFGLRKDSPYSGVIKYHLNRMANSGLIKRFQKSALRQPDKNNKPDYTGVELAEIFHYFVFLSVGIVVTTMFLFYEKIHSKRKIDLRRQKKGKEMEFFKNYQINYNSYFEYYR